MGIASVIFSLQFPEAKVISVEMSPQNYQILKANTHFLKNVIPINAGVFNSIQTVYFSNGEEKEERRKRRTLEGWAYMLKNSSDIGVRHDAIPVKSVTVDFLENIFGIKHFDFVKMDVEGSELEIFSRGPNGYDPHTWFKGVQLLLAETHDRLKEGCTAAIHNVVREYTGVERTSVGEYKVWYHSSMASAFNKTA